MAVIAYTFAGFILYFLAVTLYNSRLWTGDEPIYQLVHWADMRRDILALLYLMVGYIAIFSYYWKRPFVYLQEVADAAETPQLNFSSARCRAASVPSSMTIPPVSDAAAAPRSVRWMYWCLLWKKESILWSCFPENVITAGAVSWSVPCPAQSGLSIH